LPESPTDVVRRGFGRHAEDVVERRHTHTIPRHAVSFTGCQEGGR
jgi:hypothetical protein